MKVLIFLLSFSCSILFAQTKSLKFYNFEPSKNEYVLDWETNQTKENLNAVLDSLKEVGYYTLSLDSIQQNEKQTNIYLNKGKLYKNVWIKNDTLFTSIPKRFEKEDFFPIKNIDSLKQLVYKKYAEKGYPFSKLTLKPQGYKNNEIQLSFELELLGKRTINAVEIVGYDKLSKAYIKHGLGLNLGGEYNEEQLKSISERTQQSSYIQEVRAPQTLFAKDSTVVYLYLKKQLANYFDGIIGFGNDENGDFRLNGNVDLELNNNFNGLETIGLHWQSTADRNTTLNLNVRIPYLFGSAVGSETRFELFRQDSVFVNTKASEQIFYQLNPNSNLGLNLSYEGSNFVLNDNPAFNQLHNDYTKTGIGLTYEFLQPSKFRILEPKNYFRLSANALQRTSDELEDDNQYQIDLKAFRLFNLAKSHLIKVQLEGQGLFSDNDVFLENELFRFGGFGSLRGFNEQSLIADAYGVATLEYRFVPNEDFYIAVFGDYAFLENQLNNVNENLFGIGTGFSFLTKIGVFNISYAVGKFSETPFDFMNSKIHFGLISRF